LSREHTKREIKGAVTVHNGTNVGVKRKEVYEWRFRRRLNKTKTAEMTKSNIDKTPYSRNIGNLTRYKTMCYYTNGSYSFVTFILPMYLRSYVATTMVPVATRRILINTCRRGSGKKT
jgi:hypothetical protein